MTKDPVSEIKGGHRDDVVYQERRDLIYPYANLGDWLNVFYQVYFLSSITFYRGKSRQILIIYRETGLWKENTFSHLARTKATDIIEMKNGAQILMCERNIEVICYFEMSA